MADDIPYISAKNIVMRTKGSDWFGAEYNMNIYRGCSHGCIYCDSRSDCYHEDNFSVVKAKKDALAIIRNDLRRKVKKGIIGTGSMSDPYNPLEEELKLTRHALELVNAYGFGIAITTKSTLVTRDIDVLCDIKEHSPVIVNITITCADDDLSSKLEPFAPLSSERFKAIGDLSKNGIFCGILLMPVLPFVNDNAENIASIVRLSADAGAKYIFPAFGVTQRAGQREYFHTELEKLFPGKTMQYNNAFGEIYSCKSPNTKELAEVFKCMCSEHGIISEMQTIISTAKRGYGSTQLSFIEFEKY